MMRMMLECGPLDSCVVVVRQEQASSPGKREAVIVGREQRNCGGWNVARTQWEIHDRIQDLDLSSSFLFVSVVAHARSGGRGTRALIVGVQSGGLDEKRAPGEHYAAARSPPSCVLGSSNS